MIDIFTLVSATQLTFDFKSFHIGNYRKAVEVMLFSDEERAQMGL